MTRREKINAVKLEINNYELHPNGIPFFPLPDRLADLIKLFNVDNTGNAGLIEYVNDEPIKAVTWCLNECNCGYGKDDWWINKTIEQVKNHSSTAINNFFVGCRSFEVNILNDELPF